MGTILLTITICLFSLPVYAKYSGGMGEPNEPYQIWTAKQMNKIEMNPDDRNKQIKSMADINLGEFTGMAFNMIGVEGQLFSGIIDGNGKRISNFTYKSSDKTSLGLFGSVQGTNTQVKNLRLTALSFNAETGNIVSALVGYLHSGRISSCHVEDDNVSGDNPVGELVARSG